MSRKKAHHEEHVDESWLIPYADVLTLLLALFIVMFAVSQVDVEKFKEMGQQFNIIFSGGEGIFDRAQNNPTISFDLTSGLYKYKQEEEAMKQIKEYLEEQIEKEGFNNKVVVSLSKEGLEITIQDAVLFESGSADVRNNFSSILSFISKTLYTIDNKVKIVGHTDNIPINTAKFRSNWDLSVMRAINVMKYFSENGQISENRFFVQGNGEFSPKVDNSTPENRSINRRVEIFIIRNFKFDDLEPEEKEALMNEGSKP